MGAWLWWAWLQIWPNLAANVIWVPAAAAHHVLMKRHITRLHVQGVAVADGREGAAP